MRKAFICPTKYVQGEDELLNLGYFVKSFGNIGTFDRTSGRRSQSKRKTECNSGKISGYFC